MIFENIIVYCLFNFRWVFVCLFLLPCSVLYDLYLYLEKIVYSLSEKKLSELHHEKTRFVQDQVKQWQKSGRTTMMCLGRPGWKAMTTCDLTYKDVMYNIHVDLKEILDIDFQKKIVRVEPLVTMGQLTAYLSALHWTLPLVAELDDLTVGGLIMGTGIESSSHIVGLFQHICMSFELVLPDGSLVQCSKEEDPDLYYAVPWSYGTLGFLTSVDLQIVPSKKYVKLTYEPFYSLHDGVQLCEDRSRDQTNNQFVEGILFSKNEGVIMSGKMVDDGNNINVIGRWYKPWFYKHVEGFLTRGKSEECIPLRDYYHRHTKSLFWELEDILSFGNNVIFRWLFGWMMPPKIALLKLTQSGFLKELYRKQHVLQDFIIPIRHLQDAITFFDKEVRVYPIWLCPALIPSTTGMVHANSAQPEIFIDIGLYGMPKVETYNYLETTKRMEDFILKIKGYQMLYPGTYCSEKQFETMFDHKLYDRLRTKLNCDGAFPRIYGKVNKQVRQ